MTGASAREYEQTRRLADAAAWRVALSDAGLESSEAFEAWLASDPANATAWARVQAPWDLFGRQATAPELLAARSAALARARRQQRRRAGRLPLPGPLAWRGAASLAMASLLGLGLWISVQPQSYQTARGERRTIQLQDGSRVALDSDTLLRVRLTQDARKLELVRGQARFDVAHDVSRPFSVHVGDEAVVATGTSFNVDLLGSKVTVTLMEGRVSILDDAKGPSLPFVAPPARHVRAALVAGERLMSNSKDAPGPSLAETARVEKADLDRAAAWQSGQLIFDNEPLSSVVERVSRYSPRPVIADGPAAGLRLSGVFNASDAASFAETAQQILPITAEQDPDGTIHLKKRG